MAAPRTTPLIKLIGLFVLIAFLVLVYNMLVSDSSTVKSGNVIGQLDTAQDISFDEGEETTNTLAARLKELSGRLESIQAENQELRGQIADDKRDIVDRLENRLEDQSAEQQKAIEERFNATQQNQQSVFEELSSKIDSIPLKPDVGTFQKPVTGGSFGQQQSGDYVGAGSIFDDSGAPVPESTVPDDQIEWIAPISAPVLPAGSGLILPNNDGAFTGLQLGDEKVAAAAKKDEKTGAATQEVNPRPVYTIPENATLLDSTAMTALIGRVPFQGAVSDPLRFKVLIGADNLATNGLDIPNVVGMVASGVAVGDWTLSCVRGTIDSLTFTFEDGTIHTISSRGSATGEQGSGFGTLSDQFGVPCIPGERISNASQFLLGRVVAAGFASLSEAFSQAEVTVEPGELGGENAQNITGDAGKFALFQLGRGAADELGQYLKERQAQTFDAIFVPSGAPVALHIEQQIEINFDKNGRKLNHGSFRDAKVSATLD